jgi:histone deacetylase HOS2
MNQAFLSNGDTRPDRCGNYFDEGPIVQEWDPANRTSNGHIEVERWRGFSPAQQQAIIEDEADHNGVERPRGYTVSFHYNPRVEAHHFGRHHPMKPWRLTLTKQLILSYGIHYAMDLFESRKATKEELATFHSRDYLDFLSR